MTPDITGRYLPCWTRQGLSSHAFLCISALQTQRFSDPWLGNSGNTVQCITPLQRGTSWESGEGLTLACAWHQPSDHLGKLTQSWQIVAWRLQKLWDCCKTVSKPSLSPVVKRWFCVKIKGRKKNKIDFIQNSNQLAWPGYWTPVELFIVWTQPTLDSNWI